MRGRRTVVLLALAVAASPAYAEKQQREEGAPAPSAVEHHPAPPSDSGQSYSGPEKSFSGFSAAEHHASPRGESHERPSSGARERSSGARERSSGGTHERSSASPPRTEAQRRHPRAGTGTGYRAPLRYDDYRGRRSYDPYYYSSYRYRYWPYSSWDWGFYGYSPYYYSGYYGYSPSYYQRGGYRYYRDSGSVRLLVDPEQTRVYVDGYYAGVVDDFDGIFQRLSLPPGRHEITLKLEGYKTHRFKAYVPVDQTLKIHHDMVRGEGEEAEEVLGRPAGYVRDDDRDRDDRYRGDRDRDDRGYAGDSDDDGRDDQRRGTLRLDVKPADASVYVDGAFRGSAREARAIRLPVGSHRIEVVRPGFRTVEREVEVRQGDPTELKVELERY